MDLTVTFAKKEAGVHARYSVCTAMGMHQVDGEGRHKISFELVVPNRSARAVLLEALDAMEAHVDDALLQIAKQDGTLKNVSNC